MTKSRDLGNLAQTVAVNLPTSLGTAGQTLVVNNGADGLEFGAAAGGSMTVYNDINGTDGTPSGYTYLTNASSPANGDLAFVTANNTVYVRAASGWRKIATVQEAPSAVTGHSASYPDIGANATTDITLSTTDPEGFAVTWSYVVGGNGTLSGSNINNSNGDTLASIAVQTANSNSGGTNTITYRITRETTSIAGDFTITFTATDSQSTGTSDTGAISFELAFIVADSHYTTLLMATDGSAGDNNDITDSSSSNHTITVNGDAHASTFSPYRHGGYSTYFDGSGADLTIADHTSFDFGTGDFTVETWFYLASDDGTYNICAHYSSENNGGIWLGRWANGFVFRQAGVADVITASSPPSANEWHHVAVSRSSGSTRMFIDGTQVGSTVTSDTNNYSASAPFTIGHDGGTTADQRFTGYLSDFRIVKGTAITPPSGGPTERLTAVTNTSLLTCHLPYIADGSSNGHSITVSGGLEAKPIGPYDYGHNDEYSESVNGGSVYFDGNDDYLTVYDTGLSLGNNSAFTVEFWFLTSKNPDALQNIWNTYSGSTASLADEQLKFAYNNQSTGAIYFYDKQNSNNILQVTNKKLGRNTWNHFCWTRDASNNHKFYINGEQIGTSTSSTSYNTNRWAFGLREHNLTGDLEGNISDFRLVKGTVVYSGEFTPPTGPLTTTGGTYSDTTNVNTSITASHTKLLISGTDAHVIDKSQVSNLKLVGTAAAVTNATNNSTISSTNAVSFDGDSDYVRVSYESIPSFGAGEFTIEGWIYMNNLSGNQIIVDKYASGNSQSFQLYYRSTGTSLTFYVGSSILLQDPSSSTISVQTWHHFAVTRDGSNNVRLYVDGLKKAQSTSNVNFDNAINLHLGVQGSTSTNYFNGYMQDIRLSNKAHYTADDHSASSSASIKIPSAPLKG